jgi:hypothetical protein
MSNKPLSDVIKYFEYSELENSGVECKDKNLTPYIDAKGYWVVRINRSIYKIHRIIFKLLHANFNENLYIDHIDGNKENNNISNLRVVDHGINMKNKRKYSCSVTGYNGITKRKVKQIDYLRVYIRINGVLKERYLNINKYGGYENCLLTAIKIRDEMQTNDFTERHGK